MQQAAKHSAFVIVAFLVTSVLNYVFGVGLSWFLAPADYGVLGVAQSLLLLAALIVSAGFSWTANHELASGDVTAATRSRFRMAWLANVVLGLIVALALWASYASGLLDLGPAYRLVVPLVGLTVVFLAARSVVNGAAQGLYRFGNVAVNQVIEVAVKFSLGLVMVAAGLGAAGVIAAFAFGAAAAFVHSLWIVRADHLWAATGWYDHSVLRVTVPLFVGMLGPALMLNLDILGLKLLAPAGSGDELAGYYQAAVILARIPVFTARSLTMVVFSYVAGAQAKRWLEAPDYGRAALRAWQRLLLPAGLALAVAPDAALMLFFPATYAAAAPALRVAALGGALLALVTLLTGILQAGGQRRVSAVAAAAATAVQIGTLWWFVPRWGPVGAAASLVSAGLVALAGLLPVILQKRPLPAPAHVLHALLPLAVLVIPLLVLPDGTRLAAFLKFALAAMAYLAALMAARSLARPALPRPALWSRFVDVLIGG